MIIILLSFGSIACYTVAKKPLLKPVLSTNWDPIWGRNDSHEWKRSQPCAKHATARTHISWVT